MAIYIHDDSFSCRILFFNELYQARIVLVYINLQCCRYSKYTICKYMIYRKLNCYIKFDGATESSRYIKNCYINIIFCVYMIEKLGNIFAYVLFIHTQYVYEEIFIFRQVIKLRKKCLSSYVLLISSRESSVSLWERSV